MNKKRKNKNKSYNHDKALDEKRLVLVQVLKLIEETTADSLRNALQKIGKLREKYPTGDYIIKKRILDKKFLKLDETLTGIDKEVNKYNEEANFTPKDLNTHNYI